MLERAVLAVLFTGLVLLCDAGPVLAQEFCLGTSPNDRFHLKITGQTTTTVGTVMSLVGLRHVTGTADVRSPVTGTLFVDDTDPTQDVRVSLLEMNSGGTSANLIWNARISRIVGFASSFYSGPFTLDQLPEGMTLFGRSSGSITWVDCQTGREITF